DRIDSQDRHVLLVVRVEVRPVMRPPTSTNMRMTMPKNRDSSGIPGSYTLPAPESTRTTCMRRSGWTWARTSQRKLTARPPPARAHPPSPGGARPSAAPADWETTRRTIIDPLNTELHRHLPAFLKSRDLDAVLALYATATGGGLICDRGHAVYPEREEGMRRWEGNRGPEPIRTRYERLLA